MEEKILEAALKVSSAAEVYSETVNAVTVSFEANRCHSIENSMTRGYGVRVIWNDRLGFSSTTDPERVDELLDAAVTAAKFGEPVSFELPPPQILPEPLIASTRISLLPAEMMKLVGESLIELCAQRLPRMQVDLRLHRRFASVRLVNSEGFDGFYEKASYSLDFVGLQIIDGSLVWFTDFRNLSRDGVLDAQALVDGIAGQVSNAAQVAELKTGRYPCIFAHSSPLALLEALMLAVDGKNFEKGISPLVGKEGVKLLDEKLTIWDDGLRPFGFGSAPFDGEGIPRQKTPLFERGVFRNFLFDLKTASAVKRKSTGSAARNYSSVPQPAVSNLVVRPGTLSLADAIRKLDDGIIIYSTVGAGQSNLLAGDFSVSVSLGFRIHNGEIVGRLKDTMIAGNIYELGKELVAVGDTAYDFGDAAVPFLYFPEVSVATR